MEEFEILLKQNPDTHLKIQAVTELWNQEDHFLGSATESDYQKHLSKLGGLAGLQLHGDEQLPEQIIIEKKSRNFLRWPVAVTSLLVISALVVYQFMVKTNQSGTFSKQDSPYTISTLYGSRSMLALPDGSKVWLNSGSKLTYNKQFGDSIREVYLTGEGFFDVVHNEQKPFIVHTSFFVVKDLGTQFNVKCYPEDTVGETSLIAGSVEVVNKEGGKWTLKPDEKLRLVKKTDTLVTEGSKKQNRSTAAEVILPQPMKLTYKPEDYFAVETAWVHNKLSFDDEVFTEVAKKMERWYDADFEFRTNRMDSMHITVSFKEETLEQAMAGLKFAYRLKHEIKGRKVIIY
jgi:transmembrane sensor